MNLRRGIVRLLIVLLAVVGLAALLIKAEVNKWGYIEPLSLLWFKLFLFGLAGYCALRLLRLIRYLYRRVLNRGKSEGEKRRRSLNKGISELALISAGITGGVLFGFSFAKGEPDAERIALAAVYSLIFFVVSFGLVWAVYGVILFVARGFAGNSAKDEEKDLKVEEI